jgi:hypothetical protein
LLGVSVRRLARIALELGRIDVPERLLLESHFGHLGNLGTDPSGCGQPLQKFRRQPLGPLFGGTPVEFGHDLVKRLGLHCLDRGVRRETWGSLGLRSQSGVDLLRLQPVTLGELLARQIAGQRVREPTLPGHLPIEGAGVLDGHDRRDLLHLLRRLLGGVPLGVRLHVFPDGLVLVCELGEVLGDGHRDGPLRRLSPRHVLWRQVETLGGHPVDEDSSATTQKSEQLLGKRGGLLSELGLLGVADEVIEGRARGQCLVDATAFLEEVPGRPPRAEREHDGEGVDEVPGPGGLQFVHIHAAGRGLLHSGLVDDALERHAGRAHQDVKTVSSQLADRSFADRGCRRAGEHAGREARKPFLHPRDGAHEGAKKSGERDRRSSGAGRGPVVDLVRGERLVLGGLTLAERDGPGLRRVGLGKLDAAGQDPLVLRVEERGEADASGEHRDRTVGRNLRDSAGDNLRVAVLARVVQLLRLFEPGRGRRRGAARTHVLAHGLGFRDVHDALLEPADNATHLGGKSTPGKPVGDTAERAHVGTHRGGVLWALVGPRLDVRVRREVLLELRPLVVGLDLGVVIPNPCRGESGLLRQVERGQGGRLVHAGRLVRRLLHRLLGGRRRDLVPVHALRRCRNFVPVHSHYGTHFVPL